MHEVMILCMRFRFYLEVLRVCLFSLFHIMQSCMVLQIKKKKSYCLIKNYSFTWTSNMPPLALKTCFYRLLTFLKFIFYFSSLFILSWSTAN